MQITTPELVRQYNAAFPKANIAAIPICDLESLSLRRFKQIADALIADYQGKYEVNRKIRYAVVESDARWCARAMWPENLNEDWILFNSSFIANIIEYTQAVSRKLMRYERAISDPSLEIKSGMARSDRCLATALTFFLCHELAHHVFNHELIFTRGHPGKHTIRALEFAADIHAFERATACSFSMDDEGEENDAYRALFGARNSACFVAALMPLIGTVSSRFGRTETEGGEHPFLGFRALLAHHIWANFHCGQIPALSYEEKDVLFFDAVKCAVVTYLELNKAQQLERLLDELDGRKSATNRLVQPVGYMSALSDATAIGFAKTMRRIHDRIIPQPNTLARGKSFQGHPYDLIDSQGCVATPQNNMTIA